MEHKVIREDDAWITQFPRYEAEVIFLFEVEQFEIQDVDAAYRIQLFVLVPCHKLCSIQFCLVVQCPVLENTISGSLDLDVVDLAVIRQGLDVENGFLFRDNGFDVEGVLDLDDQWKITAFLDGVDKIQQQRLMFFLAEKILDENVGRLVLHRSRVISLRRMNSWVFKADDV